MKKIYQIQPRYVHILSAWGAEIVADGSAYFVHLPEDRRVIDLGPVEGYSLDPDYERVQDRLHSSDRFLFAADGWAYPICGCDPDCTAPYGACERMGSVMTTPKGL